jgi:hypothetical protein
MLGPFLFFEVPSKLSRSFDKFSHPRSAMSDVSLTTVIQRASVLIDSSRPEKSENLQQVLTTRLGSHDSALGRHEQDRSGANLQSLQQETAFKCLQELKSIQDIEGSQLPSSHASESEVPVGAIGTRDLATIRTLLSIVLKWGVQPSYTKMIQSWPITTSKVPTTSHIIDLTGAPEAYMTTRDLVLDLLTFIFPDGVHGRINDTIITVSIIERHLHDLLRPCLALGWLPKSMSSPQMPVVDEIRPKIMRLLSRYNFLDICLISAFSHSTLVFRHIRSFLHLVLCWTKPRCPRSMFVRLVLHCSADNYFVLTGCTGFLSLSLAKRMTAAMRMTKFLLISSITYTRSSLVFPCTSQLRYGICMTHQITLLILSLDIFCHHGSAFNRSSEYAAFSTIEECPPIRLRPLTYAVWGKQLQTPANRHIPDQEVSP